MPRPRIPIGGYGEIAFPPAGQGQGGGAHPFPRLGRADATAAGDRVVQAGGGGGAEDEAHPAQRVSARRRDPDTRQPLVAYWLADLDLEGRIAPATRFDYERDINRLVLPAFKGFTLREIGVARCDALLKQLGNNSYSSAKRVRTVLRQSFALAVRHEVLPRNPIDNISGSTNRSGPRPR